MNDKESAIKKALEQAALDLERGDNWFGTNSYGLNAVSANFIHGKWRVEIEYIRTGRNGVDAPHEATIWI